MASVGAAAGLVGCSNAVAEKSCPGKKQIYELREYDLIEPGRQEFLDHYFKDGLVPALNRLGIENVGVFKLIGSENPVKMYLLIPYESGHDFFKVPSKLLKDQEYLKHMKEYDNIGIEDRVYDRYKVHLLEAFDAIPKLELPKSENRIFEYRTYEGYSEDAGDRKVEMFNIEELELFRKVGISPVFFGKIIAGDNMPALKYMVWFKDMEEREAKWDLFRKSEEWGIMKVKPEYKDTATKVGHVFLEPTFYSQI
jgi:hypothetical protein